MAVNAKERIEQNNERYGPANVQLKMAAGFWSNYLGMEVTAKDICMLMNLLKISREKCGAGDLDNTQDIHGYTMIYDELRTLVLTKEQTAALQRQGTLENPALAKQL